MKVITNHHWRQFRYRYEVPPEVLADQFDYQDADESTDGFFQYRGSWYHLDDFQVCNAGELQEWDGFAPDSYFSGVAIRLSDDCEEYQVALILT